MGCNVVIGERVLGLGISKGNSLVELRPKKIFKQVNVDKLVLISQL